MSHLEKVKLEIFKIHIFFCFVKQQQSFIGQFVALFEKIMRAKYGMNQFTLEKFLPNLFISIIICFDENFI